MVAEYAVVLDLDDVVLILGVLPLEVLKDTQLDTCLVLVSLLVFDYFDGHCLACLVVDAFERLAEASLPEEVNNLETIVDVILEHDYVVTILVVVTRIVQLCRGLALDLVGLQT